uniref:ORF6 n=1 Tax=Cydia pomonella granulosis virus TaxID=28289 RepID=A0A097P1C2_GVCP|nr:ORF6 [Cydia pomonella granulovirus]AIU37074.1 ORF6 [Cydia pomonella granulovirus]QGY99394.1 ORF6 [Cydia pomonella granulovirus]QGY99678.1 ORF6 [Cydia pomonella granulovirus]QGY99820.1 ORF6 [Cydia pomonella granulovirus]
MFTKPNTIVHLPQNRRHDYNFVKFYTSLMYYKFYTSLMCHIQQGGETSPTLWARIGNF